jgi:hypothetical protein
MATLPYQSYEEAAQEYLSRLRALRDVPPVQIREITRGAETMPDETLIEQADQIADVSASMIPFAKDYLASPDPSLREGISGHLLAQAAAELQIATELIEIAAGEVGDAALGTRELKEVTRGAHRSNLREAIDGLERAMEMPISEGLAAPVVLRDVVFAAETPQQAGQALQQAASLTAGAISQQVVEIGGDLAFNLVFNTEWTAVIESAGLLSKDISKLLEMIKEGAGALIQRAINAATKTLLNVFDKILALLGKDVEDQARKQVKQWLDDIQKTGKIELFEKLVEKLYKVDKLEKALPGWLEKTTAEVDQINLATTDVSKLSSKFIVFVGRINSVGDVIGLAKFIQAQFPQVLVIVTAIRVALLAILVYAGYDYIGYRQKKFLNLTKGLTEVIQEKLKV